ncbi:MAG TPA: hypothetical protein VJ204_02475 [Solirubrobacterales bacterium]|nr:hypothetical protein [Solirubrobacterales bacterium]
MTEQEHHARLAAAALVATASNPKSWVQTWQMILAAAALVGAFGLAGYLTVHGPPAPNVATGEVTETKESAPSGEAETATTTTRKGVVGAPVGGESLSSQGEEETGGESEGNSSGSSEEGESLANLSKQGPWAFAIVALLAAVFLATGRSLNVGGSNRPDPNPDPDPTAQEDSSSDSASAPTTVPDPAAGSEPPAEPPIPPPTADESDK